MAGKAWNKGTAAFIRGLCRRLGTFRKADLKEDTWEHDISWPQVGSVLRDFLRSGEIRRIEPGMGGIDEPASYEYLGPKRRGSGVGDRVYRAMHVRGLFTAREITMLSDADPSYVCALIRRLVRSQDLERAGKADGPRKGEAAYRVRHRDKFYLSHVKGLL